MSSSLRSSLLLSYGLLIALLLLLFTLGTVSALLRNPLVYENAAQQLRSGQRMINSRDELFVSLTPSNYERVVHQAGSRMNLRVILLQTDGVQLADSHAGSYPQMRTPTLLVGKLRQQNEIGFLRDATSRVWLGLVQPLDDQVMLLLLVRRPPLVMLELFRSEFLRPITLTGLAGLALSVLIALGMAHWISAPLKRMGAAADSVAAGHFQPIRPEGPREVRGLAESFNHMVQRVQDAQQSQRDLVANVSHELKTPLTSIQGFAQSILDGVSQTPGEILQAAQVILGEANRMNRLVQDLVILARLEAGIVALQREPVNISALVRATVEKFRIQVAEAGLQLSVDVTEAAWVVGDADRLMQVLSNLLDNAVKYTPAGGLVRVSVQAQEGLVRVRVVDTGIGIEPVDRARIFERFYRADRDRSRAGMGLGLAITRQIVLAHGGAICVDPNFPQGCIFTLDLSGAGVGQVALP